MFEEYAYSLYAFDYPIKRYKIDEHGRMAVVSESNSGSQLVRDQTCVLSEAE